MNVDLSSSINIRFKGNSKMTEKLHTLMNASNCDERMTAALNDMNGKDAVKFIR